MLPGSFRSFRDQRLSVFQAARVHRDQDVVGQTMRLTQAGVIEAFTDVRSGRSKDWPRLQELLCREVNRAGVQRSLSQMRS